MNDLNTINDKFNALPPSVRDADIDPKKLRRMKNFDLIDSKARIAELNAMANRLRTTDLEANDPDAGAELIQLRKYLNTIWDSIMTTLRERGYKEN